MKTNYIISEINNNFASTYKGASTFVNSGELWDFCIETIKNPVYMSNITFANDMGVPPVKSLLEIYKRVKNPPENFNFTGKESQNMGALMGFVFKFVLGYKNQQERCTVKTLGVKTATKFFDVEVYEFFE